MELSRKGRGDLAELRVAADLVRRGYKVAIPFGENWEADLIVFRGGTPERVQVKYTRSDGRVIVVRCRHQSITDGQVRVVRRYTSLTIDWLAVYDVTSDRCFYIPADMLGEGRSQLQLRLVPAANGQRTRVRMAADFADL